MTLPPPELSDVGWQALAEASAQQPRVERVAAALRVVVLADPASSRVRSKGATAEVGRGT
jgi:hypothetical protein